MCDSSCDRNALDTHELQALLGHTLFLQTQLYCFANPVCKFIQGSRLRMASGNLRDRGDVVAVRVALDDHIELAWQMEFLASILEGTAELGLERLEVILKLTRELGVNLVDVEIILNMREKMEAMQKQIQGFVETLNEELSQRAARRPMENNSLMPVIQINSMSATRAEGKRTPEGKRKVR